jgi:tRNA nucleotidyltransferase (CCA-adding enzyme)
MVVGNGAPPPRRCADALDTNRNVAASASGAKVNFFIQRHFLQNLSGNVFATVILSKAKDLTIRRGPEFEILRFAQDDAVAESRSPG